MKPVPVGYFRTFTYQPLAFNPQTSNQYYSYQAGAKMLQPNPLFNWPSKPSYPYGPMSPIPGMPSSIYSSMQPQHHNNLQSMSQTMSPSSQSLSTAQSQTQPQVALSNNSPTHLSAIPHTVTPPSITTTTNSVGNSVPNNNPTMINTNSISEPLTSEIHLPTTAPAQFTPTAQFYNTNSNHGNNVPLRQMQYVPDPSNLQYYTNVAPVPVQQVQFVPCMCPVTLGVAPELIANKRSDDMTLEFQEQFSRAEQTPAQQNIQSPGATAAVTIDEQQH